jgi:hypothetical protein
MLPGSAAAFSAHATPEEAAAINGTYTATSDGNWAKRNHQFYDLPTATATWTVSSSCSTSIECTGQVTSDQGWSAELKLIGGSMWLVSHDVEDWEKCPDGSAFPGHQQYKFYTVDDNNLEGWDETRGPSGACGANQWLFMEMPFTLVKTG